MPIKNRPCANEHEEETADEQEIQSRFDHILFS
jgi:hypothetical protein